MRTCQLRGACGGRGGDYCIHQFVYVHYINPVLTAYFLLLFLSLSVGNEYSTWPSLMQISISKGISDLEANTSRVCSTVRCRKIVP